jgi:hypothetical protein
MTDESSDEPRIKCEKTNGQFKPGNSGRPRGSRGKAAVLAEKLAAKDIADIVNMLVTAAKAGDVQSAALLLARLWPPPKGRLVSFELPPIQTAADAENAITAVLAAVASAKLSIEEGERLVSLIEKAEVTHLREISDRLAALEAASKPREIGSHRKGNQLLPIKTVFYIAYPVF